MKTHFYLHAVFALVFAFRANAQGTFQYDQQSSDESYLGGGKATIQTSQPMGQSFTPSLSAVGFVRLYLSDDVLNGLGATVRVNVRSNSVSGPILGTSGIVGVADRFFGPVNFIFDSDVPVSAGGTYYLQPEVVTGGSFGVYAYNTFGYAGGTAFFQGVASPSYDLWFREGIVVPEPSTAVLMLAGLAMTRFSRRSRK